MVRTTVMKNGYNGTRLGHAIDEQRCAKYRGIKKTAELRASSLRISPTMKQNALILLIYTE